MGTRGMSKLVPKGSTAYRPTAKVLLTGDVVAEDIHAALDRIFELHGCTGCGLLGIDLAIQTIDPKWSSQINDIKGVAGFNVG